MSFEKEYLSTISKAPSPSNCKSVQIVGYTIIEVSDEAKQAMETFGNSLFTSNLLVSGQYGRLYFPLSHAVLMLNDDKYYADEEGIIIVPDNIDLKELTLIGMQEEGDFLKESKTKFKCTSIYQSIPALIYHMGNVSEME